MLPDLLRARDALPAPERLVVFAGSALDELEGCLVRVDARVQVALTPDNSEQLRGTKQGLAARTAKHLLTSTRTWPPTAPSMRRAYEELVRGVEPPAPTNRTPGPDDEVKAFIRKELDENPRAGWTTLLRKWRGSGRACEQKRFRGLHQAIKAKRP